MRIDLELKFEPRDLWVGLFWDRREDGLHLFVCPFPCVLFHCCVSGCGDEE